MTETLTSPAALLASMLSPAPADWGWWDVARLATAAELDEADAACTECAATLVSKYGTVSGRMVGRRTDRTAEFAWSGPWCRGCDKAHCIADGYGVE